jgi:hypothetical protein
MPVSQRHNRYEVFSWRFFYTRMRTNCAPPHTYGRTTGELCPYTNEPNHRDNYARTNTERIMAENLRLNEGFTRAKRGAYNRIRSERIRRTAPELYPRWRVVTRMGNTREYHELSNRIIRASYQVWHIPTNVQFK